MPPDATEEPTDCESRAAEYRPSPWRWLSERLWSVTAALTCVLAATTLLSLAARGHWLADLCANLRVQQVIAVMSVTLVACCFRRWRWIVLQVVLLAVHLPWLASGMQPNSRFDPRDPDITVMIANVWTENRNYQGIIDQIVDASPDVFAVLELGTELSRELEQAFDAQYSHRLVIPSDAGNFGIALYSRHALSDVQRFPLNDTRIESIAATVTKDARQYRVITTHPLPPVGSQRFSSRNAHLQQLARRVVDYRERNPDIPVIIVGDLNVTPWSPIFSDFAEAAGLRRAVHGNGLTPTWYARQHFTFGLTLDHGLISDELDCVSQQVSEYFGSDHRSVTFSLTRRSKP